MRPLTLILLISWVYVGCPGPARRAGDDLSAPSRSRVRLGVSLPQQAALLGRYLRSRPLELVERGVDSQAGSPSCRHFAVDPALRHTDGSRVGPGDVVERWVELLEAEDSAGGRLLAPLLRGPGDLRATGDALVVCFRRPAPDWERRLRHPELWIDDTGPFAASIPGIFVRNAAARPRPAIDGVDLIEEDAGEAFRAGRADLALVYGTGVRRARGEGDATVAARRQPAWDRTYALLVNPRARWVDDPPFRRWLAARLGTESMLRFVFDGQGESASRLARGGEVAGGPADREVPGRPFSAGTVPALTLSHDAGDALAAAIAARLKAALAPGISLSIEPLGRAERVRAVHGGTFQVTLVAHRPPPGLDDEVLALLDTFAPLGAGAQPLLSRLELATEIPPGDVRDAAAVAAEESMLDDALLIPLVRLFAWRISVPGLELGNGAARPGLLGLERARWSR